MERKQFNKSKIFGRFLTVRGIAEMAILVALAFVFDLPFLKVRFGEGASLSLTMLPLFIIALRFPIIDAFLGIGVVYGFITMLTDGYGFVTYPLDYLLGYGSIAIAALFQGLIFKKRPAFWLNYLFLILAVISGVGLRIMFSTLGGMIVYKATLGGSFIFNAPPMAMSAGLVVVLLFMLFPTLVIFNKRIPSQE